MRSYARIDDGVVVELVSTAEDITTLFHPDVVWVDITDLAERPKVHWSFDGEKCAQPIQPLPTEAGLALQATAKRDVLIRALGRICSNCCSVSGILFRCPIRRGRRQVNCCGHSNT
jgi:hypothetical protein